MQFITVLAFVLSAASLLVAPICARAARPGGAPQDAVGATQIFVAPNGDDSTGDGSVGKPFATVNRAQAAVRLINKGMKGDIFVYLRQGLYFQPHALSFTADDGGFNGFTIHYASYAGEEAVVHSGVQVTNWAPVPGTSIWSAPLPLGVSDARQVYINGERMTPTNTGKGLPNGAQITADGYQVRDPLGLFFNANQAFADIEFIYTGVGSSWTECRLRVANITQAGGLTTIAMQQPGFTLGRNKFYGQGISTPASIANVYSLLSASTPGQFYLNSQQKRVYYVPRLQDDMATAVVMVPMSDVLVEINGVSTGPAVNPVRFISFEDLTFAFAGWLDPNHGLGYVDMQSGFRVLPSSTPDDSTWVPVPGNLRMHTVENITIAGCTFQHLGATAIAVDDSSQSVLIRNNTFVDISCGGVAVGQVNDVNMTDPTRENGYFVIDNNFFNGIPNEFHDCAVVLAGFVVGSSITHNSIVNDSNTGISMGWGWARDKATNAGNNLIAYNYVYGSNWLLEDGGSIYVLGPQPSSIMSDNYVSTQHKLFGALYTDEGSAYWHITRNVVNDCPEWLHIWTASIHDELVDFCWTNQAYQDVHGTNITIRNITVLGPGQPFPPDAQAVIANAGVDWMQGPKP